jgi:hypothetical protein
LEYFAIFNGFNQSESKDVPGRVTVPAAPVTMPAAIYSEYAIVLSNAFAA